MIPSPTFFKPRTTGFGLVVMESDKTLFKLPHAALPCEAPSNPISWTEEGLYFSVAHLGFVTDQYMRAQLEPQPHEPTPARPKTPDQERVAAEHAASTADQGDWGSKVYLSVTGLRWRCCGNLFEDEHSPWCQLGNGLQRGWF